MFSYASSFSGDLSDWDVDNVEDMSRMFEYTTSFNSNLSSWNIESVEDMKHMFDNSKLSVDYYSSILVSWYAYLTPERDVTLGALNIDYYNTSTYYRQNLIDIYNWTIIDGNPIIDSDGDGTYDDLDNLRGNLSNVPGNSDLNVSGGGDWISVDVVNLNFTKSSGKKLFDITMNLSVNILYMEKIVIERIDNDNTNTFLIRGFNLSGNDFKTIYFDFSENSKFENKLCIIDDEINSFSSVTQNCNGDDEFLFENVLSLGESAQRSNSYINISWDNYDDKILKIVGLKHSAIKQYIKTTAIPTTSSSSSSGGSGGSYWTCLSPLVLIDGDCIEPVIEDETEEVIEYDTSRVVDDSNYESISDEVSVEAFAEHEDSVIETVPVEKELQDVTCSGFWACYWWALLLIILVCLFSYYYYNNKKNQINDNHE